MNKTRNKMDKSTEIVIIGIGKNRLIPIPIVIGITILTNGIRCQKPANIKTN